MARPKSTPKRTGRPAIAYAPDVFEGLARLKRVPDIAAILARELQISRAAIYSWKVVPAERARAISEISGIPPHVLRPDIYGR